MWQRGTSADPLRVGRSHSMLRFRLRLLFGGAVFCLSAASASADQLLKLDQAIALAMTANHGQLALADQVELAEIDYASARAAYKTKFMATSRSDVRAGAELGSRSGVFLTKKNLSGSGFSAGLYNSDFDDKSLSELRFSYTLPVFQDKFSEGELALTRADMEQVRKENLLQIGQQELAKQVTSAYYNLIIALDREDLANASLNISERSLKATQIQWDSGKLSAIEAGRAELRYLASEQSVESAAFARAQAQDHLKILLGMSLLESINIDRSTDVTVDNSLLDAPPEVLEENALIHRVELQGKRDEVSMARKKLQNKSGAKLPAIDIDLHYALVGEGDNTEDSFKLDDQKWGVGFRMDTDFAGTERKNRRRKLYLVYQARERELEHMEQQIRMEVRRAQFDAMQQARALSLHSRELALAEQQFEQARILHDNDQLGGLELLESERKLLEAEHKALAAEVKHILAVMELGIATGTETLAWDS